MKQSKEMVDAVRVVGQLLLNRPTTGAMYRDKEGKEVNIYSGKASCFCYVGACNLVDGHLFGVNCFSDPYTIMYKMGKTEVWGTQVSKACDKALGRFIEGSDWDDASPEQRKAWATKLANFEG